MKINKKNFIMAVIMVLMLVCVYEPAMVAEASEISEETSEETSGEGEGDDVVLAKFNLLESIVTSFISGLGTLITLWGISEWGMAFQGNDGMMQSHSFKRIGGGMIMIIAPQILSILT